MKLYKAFSKQAIARILGVNRGTLYNWEAYGFPVKAPERPGRPAKVDFEQALTWYLEHEEIRGTSEKGLQILEQAIRTRKEKFYGTKP